MSVLLLVAALGATDIDVTVSDAAGNRLTPLQPIAWQPSLVCNPPASAAGNHAEATIAIPFPLQDRQTIGGFGASFTESSAINLNALPTSKQQELLDLLFGESGARLSAMKTTMLANDFAAAAPWSTYDDSAGDTALTNFSIARDLQPNGSLTLVKRAIAAGFDGTLQAYMDYPPDWMLQGRLPQNATVAPELYDTLARYQAMYIEAYAKHGVVIDFFECFNEPTDSYTQMSPRQLIRYLGEHIGPLLDKRGIRPRTKLTYGGQADRLSAADFVTQVMADPVARRYMDVIAYHGYDCQYEDDGSCNDARQNYDKIAALAAAYPGVPLWLTEICYAYNGDDPNCTKPETLKYCTDYPRNHVGGAPDLPRRDFADGATWGHRIVRELQAGASGWIYWNLLLDQRGGPFALSPSHADADKNFQHPVVVVDTVAGTYDPTGLFFFLAHFSRFVRPGAVRIGMRGHSLPDTLSAVAFRSNGVKEVAEGDTGRHAIVLQVVNKGDESHSIRICSADRVAEVVVTPKSITTLRWSP